MLWIKLILVCTVKESNICTDSGAVCVFGVMLVDAFPCIASTKAPIGLKRDKVKVYSDQLYQGKKSLAWYIYLEKSSELVEKALANKATLKSLTFNEGCELF